MDLRDLRYWVFDMDGTLTVPIHDFDAIRAQLALPPGRPILEEISARPADERDALTARLDLIESELATRACPQPHAQHLLAWLAARTRIGVLTRASRPNAITTLAACGLDRHLRPEYILGRDDCAPKPAPDGIRRLLALWSGAAERSAVVGDYLWDLLAGRAAGATTIYLDSTGAFPHRAHADLCVRSLGELVERLDPRYASRRSASPVTAAD